MRMKKKSDQLQVPLPQKGPQVEIKLAMSVNSPRLCLLAIELAGHHIHRADRTADGSGKTRGGGLCIYINQAWCTNSIITESHCSPNAEFLIVKCRPFYLPRELASAIVTAVYIPLDANAKLALKELHAAISKQQTKHPEAAFIVAGDFNHANLKTVLPRFYQHVSCHTKGDRTLGHVYSNIAGAYKATPLPHIGHSDHLCLSLPKVFTTHSTGGTRSEDNKGVA